VPAIAVCPHPISGVHAFNYANPELRCAGSGLHAETPFWGLANRCAVTKNLLTWMIYFV